MPHAELGWRERSGRTSMSGHVQRIITVCVSYMMQRVISLPELDLYFLSSQMGLH